MMTPGASPIIRPYRSPEDAVATFALFQAAIRETASALYDADQIQAWAGPPRDDLTGWDERRRDAGTLVAELDRVVVGFTDLGPDGLVDMLYVSPLAGRRGVARVLVTEIKQQAKARGIRELVTHASRSAQPAFEHFGFTVVADRPDNRVRGVVVPNAEMRCRLSD